MGKFLLRLCLISFFDLTACRDATRKDEEPVTIPEQSKNPAVFYVYGELMPHDYLDEEDSLLTKPFNFVIKRAAYCEVDAQLIDSVIQHNQKIRKAMKVKYGTSWIEKVEVSTGKKLLIPFEDGSR